MAGLNCTIQHWNIFQCHFNSSMLCFWYRSQLTPLCSFQVVLSISTLTLPSQPLARALRSSSLHLPTEPGRAVCPQRTHQGHYLTYKPKPATVMSGERGGGGEARELMQLSTMCVCVCECEWVSESRGEGEERGGRECVCVCVREPSLTLKGVEEVLCHSMLRVWNNGFFKT